MWTGLRFNPARGKKSSRRRRSNIKILVWAGEQLKNRFNTVRCKQRQPGGEGSKRRATGGRLSLGRGCGGSRAREGAEREVKSVAAIGAVPRCPRVEGSSTLREEGAPGELEARGERRALRCIVSSERNPPTPELLAPLGSRGAAVLVQPWL